MQRCSKISPQAISTALTSSSVSGTAFFTYGLFWGINNGYLTDQKYTDAALKGWNYLNRIALQKDWSVGYVQPIGEKAIPGQTVDAKSTADFGTGAWLLAACEYVRFLEKGTNPDRAYWADLAYKMAYPVLSNMAKGELQKNMLVEVSPNWDGRSKKVTYMETFGRLMAGIAPWLSLPDDGTPEGARRSELREMALKSYVNAVDPTIWHGAATGRRSSMPPMWPKASSAASMPYGFPSTASPSSVMSKSSPSFAA